MELKEFFNGNRKIAIAFSGGTDSAYLLYEAKKHRDNVAAYYVKTRFQPQFEYDDAARLARELRVKMTVVEADILSDENIVANGADRCYHCKKQMLCALKKQAEADGYHLIADGTNASDSADDRPGMKALDELCVRSPLRECGLTKADVRRLSREAGLFTWDKPAYACLATRIKCGEKITAEKLEKTETAESFLMSLGFRDMRVRLSDGNAKIQIVKEQFPLYFKNESMIKHELEKLYGSVSFDKEGRK